MDRGPFGRGGVYRASMYAGDRSMSNRIDANSVSIALLIVPLSADHSDDRC